MHLLIFFVGFFEQLFVHCQLALLSQETVFKSHPQSQHSIKIPDNSAFSLKPDYKNMCSRRLFEDTVF